MPKGFRVYVNLSWPDNGSVFDFGAIEQIGIPEGLIRLARKPRGHVKDTLFAIFETEVKQMPLTAFYGYDIEKTLLHAV